MKQWTKNEVQTAKLVVRVEHKMGKAKVVTEDLVLRPSRMSPEDLEKLIGIFQMYGKSR